MSRPPIVSGSDMVKAMSKIGYYVRDQKGSHIHLRHPFKKPLTIPNHKEMARGTVKAILKDAEIPTEEFIKLLK
jgi:predicted RNA binding protein YcfA (HicA-like mRNA interferase family)